MNLRVETGLFQKMVAKAIKGSVPTEEAEITESMAIQLKDGKLTLITTDSRDYFYVSQDKISGDDFYVVVSVDKFSKLVSKTTSKEIVLEIKRDTQKKLEYLSFKGDGTYKIDLPYDYDGELVKFPDPVADISDLDSWKEANIQLSTVNMLLTTAKASVLASKDTSIPYTGYYLGDRIITTDTYTICVVDMKLFDDPCLIMASTAELVGEMDQENINVLYSDDRIIFSTDNVVVYSVTMDSISEYPTEAIYDRTDAPFASKCGVSTQDFARALDRLLLFVKVADVWGVYLTFTNNGLSVYTKSSNGDELIPYVRSTNFKDYTCLLDIKTLMKIVKANKSATIDLLYGRDDIIKIVDGNVSTAIALSSEDEEDDEDELEDMGDDSFD